MMNLFGSGGISGILASAGAGVKSGLTLDNKHLRKMTGGGDKMSATKS
jgi:hypothetical protein